jgi:hypothetical protein
LTFEKGDDSFIAKNLAFEMSGVDEKQNLDQQSFELVDTTRLSTSKIKLVVEKRMSGGTGLAERLNPNPSI